MIFDLRSDTVTQPTPAMREAMASAEVGDDVYGEDSTVNRLQSMAAERMGKEAGLFVPSGTMGNLIAVLAHCGRGDEVILGNLGHTFLFEGGGIAALGGVHSYELPTHADGTLALTDIRNAIRADDPHYPVTRLITLEDTHNRCGGIPLPLGYLDTVGELAREAGIAIHLDGARIFNAAVAHGIPADQVAKAADSVTFCLSKGLCAPVGSVLCGTQDFIRRARRIRKQVGGGMRQAGILAAAGIVALETMVERLADDHRRARDLAQGLGEIAGVIPEHAIPPTNMVFVRLADDLPLNAQQVVARLAESNVRVGAVGDRRMRMVLHHDVDDMGVAAVIAAMRRAVE